MSYQNILDKLGSRVKEHTRVWFEYHREGSDPDHVFLCGEFSEHMEHNVTEFGRKYNKCTKNVTAALLYILNEGI